MQSHAFPSHENKKVEKLLAQLAIQKAAARSQNELTLGGDSRPRLSGVAKLRRASCDTATPSSL